MARPFHRVIREDRCRHLTARESGVTPSARGCEECLKIGAWWASSHLLADHVGVATSRTANMRPATSTRPAIRSSRAMIRRKV